MRAKVAISKELLEMILEGARALHPKETIVLLRGKVGRDIVNVSEVVIPPLATYGRGFSGFPTFMLPMDFSIIGTAHSHPSGNLKPSPGDLNHSLGKLIFIVGFPYRGKENAAVYDRDGEPLVLEII
jgi:proteasome lid subunit RPN8/RPN11